MGSLIMLGDKTFKKDDTIYYCKQLKDGIKYIPGSINSIKIVSEYHNKVSELVAIIEMLSDDESSTITAVSTHFLSDLPLEDRICPVCKEAIQLKIPLHDYSETSCYKCNSNLIYFKEENWWMNACQEEDYRSESDNNENKNASS